MIKSHQDRHTKVLTFVQKHTGPEDKILDLGTENELSLMLKSNGLNIENTSGENLDLEYEKYANSDRNVLTAFEIFEHMLAPFNILYHSKADKLIASVPLKLWFVDAYWNEENDWDKHYHEFEIKQFDFLLKQSGWVIKDSETWKSAPGNFGIRPLLRRFYPRYYIVYCERA
jgi:hypothetical protein